MQAQELNLNSYILQQYLMPSTRRQKAKARRSREMDMLSDFDNLDMMLGNGNNNPIERELADAIDQSSTHGDADTNMYHGNEYRDYSHEIDSLRQNEVRQSFEAFSNEFNLRLSQELDSMMSMMHRAITTAIAERVIPEIQNFANSMSSTGHRETEASLSPNSQENREGTSGPKIKIAKKDSRSVGDLRDTTGHGSHRGPFGENFFSGKKVSQCRKKTERGTLWSRPACYVTRENRNNLFGSVRYVKWCNLVQ